MPSTTFYKLPAEKRDRLLAAARAEFARVAYEDASINRIIRAAQIPRGSFYMYFADKEDLFRFLMESYSRLLEAWMAERLDRNGGDLFEAFLALFDDIQANWQGGALQELAAILRRNRRLQPGLLLDRVELGAIPERLRDRVDLSRLDLRAETDLSDIFHLLVSALAGTLVTAGTGGDLAGGRARLARMFGILRRGADAKPRRREEA